MAGLLLRDIPETLHERLKARALSHRRGIAQEAISILESALEDRAGPATLDEIDGMRIQGRKPLTADILENAIREGRP